MLVNKLTKTSRPGFHLKPLEFKKFDNENLCVMASTKQYMEKTFPIRGPFVQLFISPHSTYKPVTVSTIW